MFTFADTVEKNILTDIISFSDTHGDSAGSYFVSYETNSIRLTFNADKNRWVASTRNTENAYYSRWAEKKSFGTFFEEECEVVCGCRGSVFESKYLDKTKSYGFLVPLRGANKVLTRVEMPPTLILAEVKSENEWIIFDNDSSKAQFKGPWSFPHKVDPKKFKTALDEDAFAVGLTFIGKPETKCPEYPDVSVVRFLYPQYIHARQLRDNTPSILVRYGKLWKDRSPLKEEYEDHYAEYISAFEDVVRELYDIYIRRYVNGDNENISPIRHAVLRKMRSHQLYKGWDTVSENNIKDVIFKYFGDKIYKLL